MCDNCHGYLDYHSDDLCYACFDAEKYDKAEYRRRRLYRPYNDSRNRADKRKGG